jgi:hypothetical protein
LSFSGGGGASVGASVGGGGASVGGGGASVGVGPQATATIATMVTRANTVHNFLFISYLLVLVFIDKFGTIVHFLAKYIFGHHLLSAVEISRENPKR